MSRKSKTGKPSGVLTLMYLVILLILVGITILIVCKGWAEDISVSIEYNIGEIIAGILGGTGIAVAGVAYAYKTISDPNGKPDNDLLTFERLSDR